MKDKDKKTKICNVCKKEKNVEEFNKRKYKNGNIGYVYQCKMCEKINKKKYNIFIDIEEKKCCKCKLIKSVEDFHKTKFSIDGCVSMCKECKIKYDKKYCARIERKQIRREQRLFRRNNDVIFKLRGVVSRSIGKALKARRSNKLGRSILNFLPYSIQELKKHIEKQFVSWMTWENHGIYKEGEKTWQIDHIIPHSNFHYETMDCEEFQKCWALENLRPLETIENIKKGNKCE